MSTPLPDADQGLDLLEELRSARVEKCPFGNDSMNDWSVRASNFNSEFIGGLAYHLSLTTEGREVWSKVIDTLGTYAPNEVA